MLYDKRWDAKVKTSETLRVLQEAREVIASPEHWCQFVRCRVTEFGTTAHCALGALDRVLMGYCDHRPEIVLALASAIPGYQSRDGGGDYDRGMIVNFNNRKTHADVVSLFDRAIAVEAR